MPKANSMSTVLNIRLSEEDRSQLRKIAKERRVSESSLIRSIIHLETSRDLEPVTVWLLKSTLDRVRYALSKEDQPATPMALIDGLLSQWLEEREPVNP